MKVKIVKCSDNQWYTKRIGETYKVDEECNPDYYSLTNGVLILKSDTVPVSEIRYEIRDSKKIIKSCITSCEHIRDTSVGSWACEKCEHNCGIDKVKQTVQCSWQKMKRLDIRKDYEDKNIGIVTCCSDRGLDYSRVRLLNDSDIKIIIRIGEKYSITLNQVNAILKVMGLDYELYEMDWSKVEEGAEVVFWLTCGNLKGQVRGKFNSYIPNLKKVIVIVGDKVNVVDEDEVELC